MGLQLPHSRLDGDPDCTALDDLQGDRDLRICRPGRSVPSSQAIYSANNDHAAAAKLLDGILL